MLNNTGSQSSNLRRTPRQARSRQKFETLLAAAQRVISAKGPFELTTNAVAAEANLSVGSLDEYFPNKEAIILEIYRRKLAELRQAAPAEGRVLTGEWRHDLEAYIRALKAAEAATLLDEAFFDSVRNLPGTTRIEQYHAEWVAGEFLTLFKAMGSAWSEAALFDLGMQLYAFDYATWYYWRRVGSHSELALNRGVIASLAVVEPAMSGVPEPQHTLVMRELAHDIDELSI